MLPEYLKGDDEDGPSGSEEEKDAKIRFYTCSEPGSRLLNQMAVAIGDACTLLHHAAPSTLMVGQ